LVSVPGSPFTAVPSEDGKWMFVSLTVGPSPGICLLHSDGKNWTVSRTVPVHAGFSGLALTHDGKTLVGTASDSIVAFGVNTLTSGADNPQIGEWEDKSAGAVNVVITPHDDFVFVSNESTANVSVFDLAKARRDGYSPADLIGNIPVGRAPVGLAISPDEKFLYSTSEVAPPRLGWPKDFPPGRNPTGKLTRPAGLLAVIDLHMAETDPAHAVLRNIPAGDSPVRVITSSDGARVYVTIRGSDLVGIFDPANPDHPLVTTLKVGPAPVGIGVSNDGRFLFIANSNRFSESAQGSISVIEMANLDKGVIMTIPAGAFPREIRLTADGQTAIVTNFGSNTVELIDISTLQP